MHVPVPTQKTSFISCRMQLGFSLFEKFGVSGGSYISDDSDPNIYLAIIVED